MKLKLILFHLYIFVNIQYQEIEVLTVFNIEYKYIFLVDGTRIIEIQ